MQVHADANMKARRFASAGSGHGAQEREGRLPLQICLHDAVRDHEDAIVAAAAGAHVVPKSCHNFKASKTQSKCVASSWNAMLCRSSSAALWFPLQA